MLEKLNITNPQQLSDLAKIAGMASVGHFNSLPFSEGYGDGKETTSVPHEIAPVREWSKLVKRWAQGKKDELLKAQHTVSAYHRYGQFLLPYYEAVDLHGEAIKESQLDADTDIEEIDTIATGLFSDPDRVDQAVDYYIQAIHLVYPDSQSFALSFELLEEGYQRFDDWLSAQLERDMDRHEQALYLEDYQDLFLDDEMVEEF